MLVLILVVALVLVLALFRRHEPFINPRKKKNKVSGRPFVGTTGSANMTFFNDPTSMSGVLLPQYPIQWEGKTVHAIAVHQYDFHNFTHKVLKIDVRGTILYGHVVDMCNVKDEPCNPNRAKNGKNFLIDLHETGWSEVKDRVKEGIVDCTYTVVGEIPVDSLPLTHTAPTIFCSCGTAQCDPKDARWCPRGGCSKINCWS